MALTPEAIAFQRSVFFYDGRVDKFTILPNRQGRRDFRSCHARSQHYDFEGGFDREYRK